MPNLERVVIPRFPIKEPLNVIFPVVYKSLVTLKSLSIVVIPVI